MARIIITNNHPRIEQDDDVLHKVINKCLKYFGLTGDIVIEVQLVSNSRIRTLNKKFLKSDVATDVIAFWQGDKALREIGITKKYLKSKEIRDKTNKLRIKQVFPLMLGDIIISLDKIRVNAKEYGVVFVDELVMCLVHGFLHLLGYRDHTDKCKDIMRRIGDEIISS